MVLRKKIRTLTESMTLLMTVPILGGMTRKAISAPATADDT